MGMYLDVSALDAEAAERVMADPELVWDDGLAAETLFIDKGWHGLHYLLTGSAVEGSWPLAFVLHGGHELDEDDAEVRLLDPTQVAELANALKQVAPETLRERYDPAAMVSLDIYPLVWLHEGEEAFEWLMEQFEETKTFVGRAADAGHSVLLNLS